MAALDDDLLRWLAPFLTRLGHKARRRMCPLYVTGLIGPGDRKSVEPMASRWAPGKIATNVPNISDKTPPE
jgi:SRSO17 transposase